MGLLCHHSIVQGVYYVKSNVKVIFWVQIGKKDITPSIKGLKYCKVNTKLGKELILINILPHLYFIT